MSGDTVDFHKMQALGNDFLVLDHSPSELNADDIQALACRKTGIGFDQLLSITPNHQGKHASLEIFNADGSIARMCGNGLRCITKFLIDYHQFPSSFQVSIDDQKYDVKMLDQDSYSVNMKAPMMCAFHEKHEPSYVLVNIGNLHAVIFDEVENKEAMFQKLYHKHNCNVHFASIHSLHRVDIKPYERGVGPTLACGSGACATVWAAHQFHQIAPRAHVAMPGGEVMVSINLSTSEIWLQGSAEYSFYGRI